MKKRGIVAVAVVLLLTGCAMLPSKEKVGRLYQRENPERRVTRVEQKEVKVSGTVYDVTEVWLI